MLCAIQKLLSPFPFIYNTQEANFIILYLIPIELLLVNLGRKRWKTYYNSE